MRTCNESQLDFNNDWYFLLFFMKRHNRKRCEHRSKSDRLGKYVHRVCCKSYTYLQNWSWESQSHTIKSDLNWNGNRTRIDRINLKLIAPNGMHFMSFDCPSPKWLIGKWHGARVLVCVHSSNIFEIESIGLTSGAHLECTHFHIPFHSIHNDRNGRMANHKNYWNWLTKFPALMID